MKGGRAPRTSFRLINLSDIRQSWEECQQYSPLTPRVKALRWNSNPLILLLTTSRQPSSNGDFMDGVSLYRDFRPNRACLVARCVIWSKWVNYLRMKAPRCFSQVQTLKCQLNFTQAKGGYSRKTASMSATKQIYTH